MKKLILSASLAISAFAFSQTGNVGINTTNPKATLDITGKPDDASHFDGVIAPRITGEQLRLKTYTTDQTGAIVYVTTAAIAPLDNQVIKVSASGYYYFDGTIWQTMAGSSGGTSVEPWNEANTTNPATSNTQNIYQTGNVGIGNTDPTNALHVTATADPARLEGLQTGTINDKMVVVQTDGTLKTVNQYQVEVMKIGVNGITAGTSYTSNELNALRFNKYNDYVEMGVTPSGSHNYVNTIAGSSFTEGIALASFPVFTGENPVPATRTTDAINLPIGLYEITFRIRSSFASPGNISTTGGILVSVNNKYYTKTYTNIGNGNAVNDATIVLSLGTASLVDFLFEPRSLNATTVDIFDVDTNNTLTADCMLLEQVMRSEIIIKRLSNTDTTSGVCLN